jgi:hypothetical protein
MLRGGRWASELNHLNRELLTAINELFLLRKEVFRLDCLG